MRRKNEAALGLGTGAADSDALFSARHPYFTLEIEFCQFPPGDELKRRDYAAWFAARRRFLLQQAAYYESREGL